MFIKLQEITVEQKSTLRVLAKSFVLGPIPNAVWAVVSRQVTTRYRTWFTNLTVDLNTGKVLEVDGNGGTQDKKGKVQIDAIKVKPGYQPKVGETFDGSQVEDLYDIKSDRDGRIDAEQKQRLRDVLKIGDPGATDRKIKLAHSPKRQQGDGKIIDNAKYSRPIKFFGALVGVVGLHTTVMAMVHQEDYEDELDKAIVAYEVAKANPQDFSARLVAQNVVLDYFNIYTGGTGVDIDRLKGVMALWLVGAS